MKERGTKNELCLPESQSTTLEKASKQVTNLVRWVIAVRMLCSNKRSLERREIQKKTKCVPLLQEWVLQEGEDLSFRGKSKGSQEPMCWMDHRHVDLSPVYDFKGDLKHRIL